jgi:hypothetical protein
LLLVVLAASAVPRIPWLVNATATFISDEAVDALVILHLLHGHELALFNWDAHYYGIVEGLMAAPLLALGLPPPLACRLGSFAGFAGLLVALFLLGRRLYGVSAGLAAAAFAAAFSPHVVVWSVNASGGYTLVVAWGTLALLQLDRTLHRAGGANLLALGAVLGFGLYIYELFLFYLMAISLAGGCIALCRWRQLLAVRVAAPEVGRRLRAALLLAAGFVAGISPKLMPLLGLLPPGTKRPLYTLATLEQFLRNLKLLVFDCIPSLFGVNPARNLALTEAVGYTSALRAALGLVLLGVYAAAWLFALLRVGKWLVRGEAGAFDLRSALTTELVLVLLVAVTALLFLISPNPRDVNSDHYLLPWLSSLPLLAGRLLVGLARRDRAAATPRWQARLLPARTAAWALGALLVGLPLVQIASCCRVRGLLDARYRLVRKVEPLDEVVSFLERQGIRGAYGDYWSSYKATLLAGERVVVTPLADWDRYPAYTRRVDALPSEAYIVRAAETARAASLERRIEREHHPFAVRRFGPYLVYTSPQHARLLAFVGHALPLAHPRAAIAARVAPVLAAASTVEIATLVRNEGDATWPADGRSDGWYRVDLGYRWFDAAGRAAVLEGRRSRLPRDLEPGGSLQLGVTVTAPAAPGRYRLLITAVQEGVCWFDRVGGGSGIYPVEIVAARP